MLVFESRRFVELRKQGFWKQFFSAESTGMGIFYTLNVFCIQVRPQRSHAILQHARIALLHVSLLSVLSPGWFQLGPVHNWWLASLFRSLTR